MSKDLKSLLLGVPGWLSQEEHATLDHGIVSSSPTSGVETTYTQKQFKKNMIKSLLLA